MSIHCTYQLDVMNVYASGKLFFSALELTFPFVQLLGRYLDSLGQEILRKPAAS